MRLFFLLFGLIFVVEGLFYFAFPHQMKQWMKKVQETSDSRLRAIGFVAMCLGLGIAYLFKQ